MFVHYGNFIGKTLKIAAELQFDEVVMGIMIGKAVKLAEGALDTHSKKVVMNKAFLKELAAKAGCKPESVSKNRFPDAGQRTMGTVQQDRTTKFLPTSVTEMPRALYPLASQRETIRSADFGKWENNLSSVIIQM